MKIGIHGDDTAGKSEIADVGSLSIIDRIALCAAGLEAERMFGYEPRTRMRVGVISPKSAKSSMTCPTKKPMTCD